MQSTSREMLGWMKHRPESRLPGEISSITSDVQMTPPLWQKWSHHRGYLGHEDLFCIVLCVFLLPWWVRGKASACSVGDQVWSLGQEDPLEKEMATHSSPLAWKIPWATIHGVAQSVGHDWATSLSLSYLSLLFFGTLHSDGYIFPFHFSSFLSYL